MSRNLAIPYFPNAPREYNQQYISEIVRAFSVYVQQVQNPGEGRNTFGVFTNLQTDDFGLETGAIFNHEGYVKITQVNTPHARGSTGTGSVGSVTVTTT
tara:strand:- start:1238 stop:1534 length:297 start_codon:yes stop_codon:yes gene_type:complete